MNDTDKVTWVTKASFNRLLAAYKRLRKAYMIEQQIVQAFYEYRDECCFDHCEAWMLEKGHRVIVNGQSEWDGEEE